MMITESTILSFGYLGFFNVIFLFFCKDLRESLVVLDGISLNNLGKSMSRAGE